MLLSRFLLHCTGFLKEPDGFSINQDYSTLLSPQGRHGKKASLDGDCALLALLTQEEGACLARLLLLIGFSLPGGGVSHRVVIVDRARPEVAGQGEDDTPGDGEDRAGGADRSSQEQAAQGVYDGREGLVLGEPAYTGRHR